MAQKVIKPIYVVGFRLPDKDRDILIERARALRVSPHQLARQYVLERLGQAERLEDILEHLGMLHEGVTEVRADLALATCATLQHGGKATKQDAERFVGENMGFSIRGDGPKAKGGD